MHFTCEKCHVFDSSNNCVLEESRSLDNCYTFTPVSHTCHNTTINEIDLWPEKLGHLNFKTLKGIANIGAIYGLPTLGKQALKVHGPCQFAKQLKTTHKMVHQIFTSRVLELCHMDLMGLIQVESIAGK